MFCFFCESGGQVWKIPIFTKSHFNNKFAMKLYPKCLQEMKHKLYLVYWLNCLILPKCKMFYGERETNWRLLMYSSGH